MEILEKDVIEVINDIQRYSDDYHCFAYIRTIHSILRGNSMFGIFIIQQYYGKYPDLSYGELQEKLDDLCNDNFLRWETSDSGKQLYVYDETVNNKIINSSFDEKMHEKCFKPSNLSQYSVDEFMKKFNGKCFISLKTSENYFLPISDEFTYYSDSIEEYDFVKNIRDENIAKILRGQNYFLEYISKEYADHQYIPDIIFLDSENHLVIIEYKPMANMTYHITIAKYKWLKYYAEENGFYCGMMDKEFNTFEDLENYDINPNVKAMFYSIYNENKTFGKEEYKRLCKCFSCSTKNVNSIVYKNLEAIVVQDGLINSSKSYSIMIYPGDYGKRIPEPRDIVKMTRKKFIL